MDITQCPDCEFTASSEKGLKIHYSRMHEKPEDPSEYPWADSEPAWRNRAEEYRENSRTHEKACEVCGENFQVFPSRADEARFCSQDCLHRWQSETQRGQSHHNAIPKDELLDALHSLAAEIGEPPRQDQMWKLGEYSINAYVRAFGSWNQALSTAGLEPDDRAESCPDCWYEGSPRGLQVHRAKVHGENGSTKDGDYYAGGWDRARLRALRRDSGRCQDCGVPEHQHREEYSQSLHVHHITPYEEFDSPAKAHELDNLVTLCHECHADRHMAE